MLATAAKVEVPQHADLVVIGGGIQGAGIARDAALRGLQTVLFERGDFAEATSSNSSKLIHGGLRYLERAEFHLVYEALKERATLLRCAPHLVRPLSFVIPLYRNGRRAPWLYDLALSLYDLMAEPSPHLPGHQSLDPSTMLESFAPLRSEGLLGGVHYFDCQMDDARLVIPNIQDAARFGAVCMNHTPVESVLPHPRGYLITYRQAEQLHTLTSKHVVNAAGPWVDQLQGDQIRRITQAKGVHLLIETSWRPPAALMLEAVGESRIFFVIPWGEQLLVGTTDTSYQGSLEQIEISPDDLTYLWKNLCHYFPTASSAPWKVVATFAGVRPLTDDRGRPTQKLSRGYRLIETAPGLHAVLGGKYTVYRKIAAKLLHKIAPTTPCLTDQRPLPGGDIEHWSSFEANEVGALRDLGLDAKAAKLWLRRYGSQITHLKEMLRQGATPLLAEVRFAVTHEFAKTLEDFMMRRTRYYYAYDGSAAIAAQATTYLEQLLENPKVSFAQQLDRYQQRVQQRQSLLKSLQP